MKTHALQSVAPRGIGLPVGAWIAVARERARLASLEPETLADLGISPAAARAEASRPFWDLPRGR